MRSMKLKTTFEDHEYMFVKGPHAGALFRDAKLIWWGQLPPPPQVAPEAVLLRFSVDILRDTRHSVG